MLDFAALPPEINSARMYSGPGSAPMLAAAGAWDTMAAELRSAAANYGSAVSELTSAGWLGPSSMSMLAAAAPYLGWLGATATQAEQAGAQAHAAAAAYQSAFAMTVPPTVVAANRAELAMLVATNVFGQNTPAIAATEAHYGEMWAQDAAAMNGYASASSTATQLTPLTAPPSPTTTDGVANQTAAVAHAAETPAGTAQATVSSSYLAGLLSGSDNSALGTFWNGNFFSTAVVNGALAGGAFNPQFILGSIAGFSYLAGAGTASMSATRGVSGLGSGALVSASPAVGSVDVGRVSLVGKLSVPPSWASATTISPADAAVPASGLSEIGTSQAGGPGGFAPMGATDRRRRRPLPKYGFRPVVMPRPPAAG